MRARTSLSITVAIAASAIATTAVATTGGPVTIERAAEVTPSSGGDLAQARRIDHPVDDGDGGGGPDVGGPLPIAGIGEDAATLLPASQRPTGVENPAVRGSVVVSEVMFDPSVVYDSRGEWFEIVNTTAGTIDLGGWTFGDEVYDIHTISALQIAPGDRAVLGRVADPARNGGVGVDYEFGDAVLLFNGGDRIVLRDSSGSIVDVVDYGLAGFTRPEGRSISFRSAISASTEVANDNGANWCRSTTTLPAGDFGSPGAPNLCAASTASLVITEVMNNPAAASDTVGEWFELRNTGAALDLAGFSVQDDDGEKFTIDTSLPVPAGANVVFARDADPAVNGDVTADWEYGSAMSLHNTFDELVVTDARGIQVDAVRWDDGRTFPDPNGQSMQLAALAADNADGANWCLSTRRWAAGDAGSPGTDGSCDVTEVPLVVITEVMADPELTSSERNGEWFEVANLGSEPAVLDGYSLRTRSEVHVVSALTVPAGGRAVLAVLADRAANGDVPVDYAYGTDLSLFNTAGLIEIVTPDGISVDRVDYSLTRGFPLEKARSMELGSTTTDNGLGANWCATIDRYNDEDFGTPGTAGNCDEPDPAQPLMVSEVMRDPAAVSDTPGEWFEVHNPTSDAVDLRNWSISDDGSERYVIRQSVVVPAQGFAVIGRSGDTGVNGGVDVDLAVGSAMVLFNGQDAIRLHDQHGRSIDEVRWTPSDPMPKPNGGSMSRSETSLASFGPTDDASAWCTTSDQFGLGDTGTPGAANTCTPAPSHTIVINEVHRDPLALPDAQAEWIELHNTGTESIDIGGWTLRDDDVDSFVFPAGFVIGAGGYLTAGRNDASLNGGIDMDVLYGIEVVNFNTADELMLFDADLAIVDRVAWTAENGFPKVPGATMSLRNPGVDNAVGVNWCAAVTDQGNGDLGTPGSVNLCEIPVPPRPTDSTHSIFATGDAVCGGRIGVNASNLYVGTAVRTNDDIDVQGSTMVFDGAVSYADRLGLGWGTVTNAGTVKESGVQTVPFGWDVADFAPGGSRAAAAGAAYFAHPGGLTINANGVDLAAGIHYVDGDVTINSGTALLNQVTIVATGSIVIRSSQITLSPFASDLPALMAGRNSCAQIGIQLATSTLTIVGAVHAPTSRVVVNSSIVTVDRGSFVGSSVELQGSRITINRRSALVRVTAICAGTGSDIGRYKFRVRHEQNGIGPFAYDLRVASNVLHSGSIGVGETQFVWLPAWAQGVKVIPTAGWVNEYGGTASANTTIC